MAANNETRIVLTAEDKTAAAFGSVSRGLAQMESQAAMATRALGAIGVTVSAAAMVAMVKGTIDAADGFNDLSQRVGINIRQLAGWTLAANQSGTSMESVAKGIKGLSTYMVEHGDRLRAAGVTATDANGAMIQLADIFKAMPDGVEKTALAVKLFGKAGLEMLPMLNMGSEGLREAQEKADAYGKKMAELAPHADKFNDEMETLGINAKVAAINIMEDLIPALGKYAEKMAQAQKNGAGFFGSMTTAARTQGLDMMPLDDLRARAGVLQGNVSYLKDAGDSPVFGAKLQANRAELKMLQEEIARRLNVDGGMMAPYAAGTMSAKQAKMLAKAMGDDPDKAKTKAYKRDFNPEGDLEYARLNREFEEGKKRAIASEKEFEDLEKKRIAMEEMAEKRMEHNRIAAEGEEAIREAMEKTNREIKKQDDMTRDLGLTFASAFEDAVIGGKNLSGVLQGLAQDVARIFLRKTVTEPMADSLSGLFKGGGGFGKLIEGWFNGGGSPAASQGFGMAGDAGTLLGFAGGGYTGNGARSGGMDGQGGFMAMLHPQESVIDHASGGSAGGGVTINLNVYPGVAQTIRAEMANMMPMMSASIQGAVMDARLRGGSTRAAYRG